MAKKRKKSKGTQLSGLGVSKPMVKSALRAANSRLGRVLIAEALIVAAGVLTRKHPVAAVAAAGVDAATATKAAGAEAVNATKSVVGSASHIAVSLMQAAADRLRAGSSQGRFSAQGDNQHAGRNGGAWEQVDRGAIRQAIMGEFSRRKKGKKAKSARRH